MATSRISSTERVAGYLAKNERAISSASPVERCVAHVEIVQNSTQNRSNIFFISNFLHILDYQKQ